MREIDLRELIWWPSKQADFFHFWVLKISGGTEFAELGRIFTWLGVSFYWRPSILSKGRKWLLKKPFSWLFELQLQFSHYYQVVESALWRSNACIHSDFNQSLSTIGAADINWQSSIIIGLLGRTFYSRSKPGNFFKFWAYFLWQRGQFLMWAEYYHFLTTYLCCGATLHYPQAEGGAETKCSSVG